jgi:signal transduction histidine kinase
VDLVDDEEEMLELLESYLSGEGYQIRTFTRAADALEAWGHSPSDVAVVDVMMPGIGGLELIAKGRDFSPDSQFVVVSGFADVNLLVDAIRQGVNDYVTKPIESGEAIRLVVRNSVQRHDMQRTGRLYAVVNRSILRLTELSSAGSSRHDFMSLVCRAFARILDASVVAVAYRFGKELAVYQYSEQPLAEGVLAELRGRVLVDSRLCPPGTTVSSQRLDTDSEADVIQELHSFLPMPLRTLDDLVAYVVAADSEKQAFREASVEVALAFRRTVELLMEHQALEATEEGAMISELINTLPDAVVVFDGEHQIRYANAAAFQLMGLPENSPSETLRKTLEAFDRALVTPPSKRAFGTATRKRVHWDLPEGEKVVEIASHAYTSPHRVSYRQVILRDETRQYRENTSIRRLNRELEHQNARLAAVNRELDSFAYITSHDLREPFRHIQIFSQYLTDELARHGQLKGESEYLLAQIAKAVKSATTLLDDLRTLAKLTRMQNPYVRTDMNQLVRDVLERFEISLAQTKTEVKVAVLPALVLDPVKFKEVFHNFISNAIKFNRSPDPIIEIGAREEVNHVVLFVKDNGPGIDPDYHDYVFQPCKRVPTDEVTDGSGLGLAIVKRVVEEVGGEVFVESKPGEGACFCVRLSRGNTTQTPTVGDITEGTIPE